MSDETKRRVARILEESAEDIARQQLEKANELDATRRFRFGLMLGLCAVFVMAIAAFVHPNHPRDAVAIFSAAMLIFFVAGFYTDTGNALLRRIARKLRDRWGRKA